MGLLLNLISGEEDILLNYVPEECSLTSTVERAFANEHDIKHNAKSPPEAMVQHDVKMKRLPAVPLP